MKKSRTTLITQGILFILIAASAFFFLNNSFQEKFNYTKQISETVFEKPLESTQGKGDDPFAAAKYRYEMLSGNRTDIDLPEVRSKAIDFIKRNFAANNNLKKGASISWVGIGPGNIGGRIRSIVINPTNSNEIVVGSVSGGIWKTTNGGVSWSPKLDTQDPIAIASMLLVGNSTIYAGTGEAWGNIDAVYGGGIYKSTDFGDTWSLLPSTVGANIWKFKNVLVLRSDPLGNIYAVTKAYNYKGGVGDYQLDGGLYKSTNGGTSWTRISSNDFATNYFNPSDVIPVSSSVILFAVKRSGSTWGGIYRTTDGGGNWVKITSGLPSSDYNRISMTQDPNNSSVVYAVIESTVYGSPDYGLKGIYKSTDSGINWTALSNPPLLNSTGGRSFLGTQGWYDNVIAVDPFNSGFIYVGGVDIMKSTDGGSSWFQLTYWDPFFGTPVVHADHHAIVFDRINNGVIYSGNDGGIYKTTNAGNNWTNLNNGLQITQFYSGAVYPTGSTYYGGTQDNGHQKFNSGTNWTMVEGGDGGYSAQDQTNANVAYEEYIYLQMEKTTDGGNNWSSSITGLSDVGDPNKCLFIAPFAMNPENSNVLIAGSDKVWITGNGASSWTQSSNVLSSGDKVSAVTVVNSSANYLGFAGTTDGRVFMSTDLNPASGLDTWTEITPPNNNGAWVRRIVVDLNNKNRIYVCYSGYNNANVGKHVWYSSNQGSSWSDISGSLPDIPVHSLVIDPNISTVLYIGTEAGVFRSTNNGSSWSLFNSGMPSYVPVDELVLQTGTKKLFAFTHGRSVWMTDTPLPVEDGTETVPDEFALKQNYPNPFNPSTTIEFIVNEAGTATLKVYDITGREVRTLFDDFVQSGVKYSVTFEASSLASGVYYYELRAGNKIETRKMIVLK